MLRFRFPVLSLAAILLALGALAVLWPRWTPPRLSQSEVREAVYTALQQEADTAFLVTGYLDVVATTIAEDTRVLWPGIVDFPLGTTRAAVRAPGRVSYGFDLARLDTSLISVRGDTVDAVVPPIVVYSAEPRLAELQVETTRGWARLPPATQEAERRAVALLNEALRRQGEAHLRDSVQPRINTAEALRTMLTRVLVAAGLPVPYFRIDAGEGLVVTGGG
jgi:hypothetical protein